MLPAAAEAAAEMRGKSAAYREAARLVSGGVRRDEEPTERQLKLIDELTAEGGLPEFTGSTKRDASEWISRSLDVVRGMREAEVESLHGDWGDRDDC